MKNEGAAGAINRRNDSSRKTVLSNRAGTFGPKLLAKYQRRFPGFDDKIVSSMRAT